MTNVREELLVELESLVEARATMRVNRCTGVNSHSFQAAVEHECSELASVLWKLMDEREER